MDECDFCEEGATEFIRYRGRLQCEPGLYQLCKDCLENDFLYSEQTFWDTDEIDREEFVVVKVMEG